MKMLTNFDPNLKLTGDNYDDAILSLLNTLFAYVQTLQWQIIELQCMLDSSLNAQQITAQNAGMVNALFDESMAELLAKYGE